MTFLKKLRAGFLDERELITLCTFSSLWVVLTEPTYWSAIGVAVVTGIASSTLKVIRLRYQERRLKAALRQELFVWSSSSACPFDPRTLAGEPIGMLHCPECGEMVLAGRPHPDYSVLEKKE